MQGNVMTFSGSRGQKLPPPKLFRPDRMAEAVAEAVERAAPIGRRKYVENRFGMTPDDARRVVEGRASKAQLDRMFREGGWGFVLEVFALFFDRGVDQYLAEEMHRHAKRTEAIGELVRDFRSVAASGSRAGVGVAAGVGGRSAFPPGDMDQRDKAAALSPD